MHDEMVAYLRGLYPTDEDDGEGVFNFLIEAAIYWFAADYHGGQAHPLYEVLSQSEYHPSPLSRGIKSEDETTQMMYEDFVAVYNV